MMQNLVHKAKVASLGAVRGIGPGTRQVISQLGKMPTTARVTAAGTFGLAATEVSTLLARADAATNISTAVDTNLSSWIPLILTLTFLGIGLGVLFAALHKVQGGAEK